MQWVLRVFLLSNKDYAMAAVYAAAVMPFIPAQYQNGWTYLGVTSWVIILQSMRKALMSRWATATGTKVEVQSETAKDTKDDKISGESNQEKDR
jgi:hypothetical protein